ncbi:hypothetical protein NQ314_003657, partial [Rhamnusium bicolor]
MTNHFVCIKDFEEHAIQILPRNALDYYKSGAGQQQTLILNSTAFFQVSRINIHFLKYKIRPRCLRNVGNRDLSTTVLGEKVSMPIGISPTAMQKMAHPKGECANVRATSSIEEVAEAAANALKWFQLYIYKDRELTKGLVKRAERAGFKAIVLTVDAPVLANFQGTNSTDITKNKEEGSGLNAYVNSLFDATIEWKDIDWLKSITTLPVVLKGILTAEDAKLGVKAGAAGIWVSNHGARQVDGTPASIEALPEVVKAVGQEVEIYMDGGVTDGTDVFKALALGARM